MRPIVFILCTVAALCGTVASPIAAAENITVFAAASLKEAMDEQARQFERDTGNKVIVAYGASNALAKQIEAGAPADLFISADLDWMDYVSQRGLVAPDARVDLVRNTLVLIAPSSSSTTLKIAPDIVKGLRWDPHDDLPHRDYLTIVEIALPRIAAARSGPH